jgi:hypothetical protein
MHIAWTWMQGLGQFEHIDLDGLEAFLEETLKKD